MNRRRKIETDLTPNAILASLSGWISDKLSPARHSLDGPPSREMLDALRDALRESATPVGASPQPQPDRAFMLRSAARATEIVGHMLDGISKKYKALNKPAAFFVKMGRICFAMVEAAIPRSLANLVMRYWFQVLIMIEIVMIAGGTLISEKPVQGLGVNLLILTLVFRALIELIRLYLGKMRGARTVVAFALIVVSVFLWWGTIHFREVVLPKVEKRLISTTQKTWCEVARCGDAKPASK